jgi:hypothetical protein
MHIQQKNCAVRISFAVYNSSDKASAPMFELFDSPICKIIAICKYCKKDASGAQMKLCEDQICNSCIHLMCVQSATALFAKQKLCFDKRLQSRCMHKLQ